MSTKYASRLFQVLLKKKRISIISNPRRINCQRPAEFGKKRVDNFVFSKTQLTTALTLQFFFNL